MKYEFHFETDINAFDSFVINSTQNTLFQCSKWAQVKDNWEHAYVCAKNEGNIVATALLLIRHLPLNQTLFYIPRGPVMDYTNQELVKFMLENIKKYAKEKHAIAIRFDPSILIRKYPYELRKEEHAFQNREIIDYLQSLNAKHLGFTTMIEESTQPRFNAEMDVASDYREKLNYKTRKCINAAIHKGIEVYEGKEYLSDFSIAMHYTEVRKHIALRNEAYFKNMMDVYGDHAICMVAKLNFKKQLQKLTESINEAKQQLEDTSITKKKKNLIKQQLSNDEAEYKKLEADYQREGKDEVITCGILAVYNDKLMELFYMGNNPDYLRMYSSYLLYAMCLDRCVQLDITHCSFGGIEGTLDDGLTLFKSNWIMNVEEYIGEFNIVLKPLMYKAFEEGAPLVSKVLQRVKGRK